MHYHAEVLIPEDTPSENVHAFVTALMAPFDEDLEDGEGSQRKWWDWWQIGGRYKGSHVPVYDWETDPDHEIRCDLCVGTGTRPNGLEEFGQAWFDSCNGCNGCLGKGVRNMWPTQVDAHPLDVIPIDQVSDELTAWTLVTRDGVLHQERFEWDEATETGEIIKDLWDGKVKAALNGSKGLLVTVDYHS